MKFCISETEARKKWCCVEVDCQCTGSDCMAWRWVRTNIGDGEGHLVESDDTHGYCGLAGPPWSDR